MPESELNRATARIVALALAEDLGDEGDITSMALFGPEAGGAARVTVRGPCIISGIGAAEEVCRQVDPALACLPLVMDSQAVPADSEVIHIEGGLLSILAAERTLLNFLSRLSGVATEAARYAGKLEGTSCRLAATRKTSPGLRLLEKKAVADGGGIPHRSGLFDAVLIKDNHIVAAGGAGAAVEAARSALGTSVEIEVEVDSAAQLQEALEAGATQVLLDNMAPDEVRACVELAAGRAVVEASGGIGLENIRDYAEAGVDIISVGAITRNAAGIDFSLEVEQ